MSKKMKKTVKCLDCFEVLTISKKVRGCLMCGGSRTVPTIRAGEVSRLAFCNSKRLPKIVLDQDNKVKRFVGIGWVESDGLNPVAAVIQ